MSKKHPITHYYCIPCDEWKHHVAMASQKVCWKHLGEYDKRGQKRHSHNDAEEK